MLTYTKEEPPKNPRLDPWTAPSTLGEARMRMRVGSYARTGCIADACPAPPALAAAPPTSNQAPKEPLLMQRNTAEGASESLVPVKDFAQLLVDAGFEDVMSLDVSQTGLQRDFDTLLLATARSPQHAYAGVTRTALSRLPDLHVSLCSASEAL